MYFIPVWTGLVNFVLTSYENKTNNVFRYLSWDKVSNPIASNVNKDRKSEIDFECSFNILKSWENNNPF